MFLHCVLPVLTPEPHFHGIPNDELSTGPSFSEVYERMVRFVNALLLMSVQSDESSDEEVVPLRFKEHSQEVVLVAHNGYRFDFPFLLSECYRNSLSWGDIVAWRFVDTLDVLKAMDPGVYGGCQKLQCLLQRTDCCDLQAHRALDC